MTNAWDIFIDEWSNGLMRTGWESWLGHVLMPLVVLILLSNVSVVRVLLGLQRGSVVDARVPRLSVLLAPPICFCGASHLAELFAARHALAGSLANTLQALAALFWVVTVLRLSMVIARLTAAQPRLVPKDERERPRERVAVAAPVVSVSAVVAVNHMPPHPTVSGS
jgi:hypothetical protein